MPFSFKVVGAKWLIRRLIINPHHQRPHVSNLIAHLKQERRPEYGFKKSYAD